MERPSMPSRMQSRSPCYPSPSSIANAMSTRAFAYEKSRLCKTLTLETIYRNNWSWVFCRSTRQVETKVPGKGRMRGSLYNGWRGVLIWSSEDTLAVETVPKGPETIADDAFVGDTTTLLKGPTAIVDAGEIKLTLAVADAVVMLPEVVVTLLVLDAVPSIFLDSVLSVNRSIIHGYRYRGNGNSIIVDLGMSASKKCK